jgi:hypothetical protein
MTDAATGSVAPEAPAGNPPPQTADVDNGSTAPAATDWMSGLSEGNRKLAETKGWTTPESADKVLTSYAELERMQGEALRPPKDDAPPEEWNKFYSRLGRPETADKYEFKRPEGLPPDLPYSDELAKTSKAWMHEAGLNTKQAQRVHDGFVQYMAQQQTAQVEATKQAVESTHDVLVRDWGGPPDSEAFKQKHALADRAARKLGIVDDLKGAGILLPDGSLTKPQIAKALAEIGQSMFSEDTIGDGDTPGTSENPFKRDANGKIKSPGAISALVKSDPERAKRLAREAGEPIENWVSNNPR